jgi:hypothetical protein
MLATLLVFAQEVVEEEEAEPVAFYLLGGLAALWAITLFAIGMRSHTFPGSAAAQRVVTLISVLIVAAAMASAVLSS